MLYVTTRNNRETYPISCVLTENRSPDGGFYIPASMPEFSKSEILSLGKKPYNTCVAEILNLFFDSNLSGYDLDFFIGRSSARLISLPHRIWIGESWHNLEGDFRRTELALYRKISGNPDGLPADWFRIALRIGVLFGYFGKLMRRNAVSWDCPLDLAVFSGDFTLPMAAYYARTMGLPIANIILCCNDNNNPWELLHHGQMRTNISVIVTDTPEGDYAIPTDMERFVQACGGSKEVTRYVSCVEEGRMYIPGDWVLEKMRTGVHASVVGADRVYNAVPNVYSTHGQLLDAYTALGYSGLMDYRAVAGESGHALVLSERGPGSDPRFFREAMGISQQEADALLQQI